MQRVLVGRIVGGQARIEGAVEEMPAVLAKRQGHVSSGGGAGRILLGPELIAEHRNLRPFQDGLDVGRAADRAGNGLGIGSRE